MDLDLTDKGALVVGATGGIGQAVCRALVREGVGRLALGARDPEKAEAVSQTLSANGTQVVVVPCDLDEEAAPARCVAEAVEAIGPVDILVMAAGAAPTGDVWQLDDSEWERAIRSKLLASVRLVRAAGPAMMERGWGRIVLIAGLHGRAPTPHAPLGGLINSALANLVGSLSRRMVGSGVTVNGVDPDQVRTPRWEKRITQYRQETGVSDEEAIAHFRASAPTDEMIQPDEVGDLVAFLVSVRAQSVSGTPVAIDAGANPALH